MGNMGCVGQNFTFQLCYDVNRFYSLAGLPSVCNRLLFKRCHIRTRFDNKEILLLGYDHESVAVSEHAAGPQADTSGDCNRILGSTAALQGHKRCCNDSVLNCLAPNRTSLLRAPHRTRPTDR